MRRRSWLWLLIAYAASLLLIPLARDEVLTFHEVACAQPAKEMLNSRDWILPTFAGVPCLHKPPLIHWSIAAAMGVIGSQSEAAVRLPAALAGLIVCLVVALWAARWFGQFTGLLTGLIQVTSVHLQTQARLAETDILLAAAVATAIGTFAFANIPGPTGLPCRRSWLAGLFYFGVAVACLAKGPVGLVLILGPCLVYALVTKDKLSLRFLGHPAAIGAFLLVALPWFIVVYQRYPPILEAWLSDNLVRYASGLGTRTPAWYYFASILWFLLPWTPFAALGLVLSLGRLRGTHNVTDPAETPSAGAAANLVGQRKSLVLLLIWFLFGFVFFTASSYRSHHYLVPILPPFSLFAGLGFLAWINWRRNTRTTALVVLLALVVGSGVLALRMIDRQMPPEQTSVLIPLVVMLILGLVTVVILDQKGLWKASVAVTFSVAWIAVLSAQLFVVPFFDIYSDQVELARRVAVRVPHGAALYMLELPDNQIAFYLSLSIRREDRLDRFEEHLAGTPPELFILSHASIARRLEHLGRLEFLDQCRSVRPGRSETERLTLFRLSIDRPNP